MTLQEFRKYHCQSELKVMSGYNGKVLCKDFNEKKHAHLADREVHSVWAECVATKGLAFGNIAKPIICCYVDGKEEAEKALAERMKDNG